MLDKHGIKAHEISNSTSRKSGSLNQMPDGKIDWINVGISPVFSGESSSLVDLGDRDCPPVGGWLAVDNLLAVPGGSGLAAAGTLLVGFLTFLPMGVDGGRYGPLRCWFCLFWRWCLCGGGPKGAVINWPPPGAAWGRGLT